MTNTFITIKGKTVSFPNSKRKYTFSDIQKWADNFHKCTKMPKGKWTMEIENEGAKLVKSGFADKVAVWDFAHDVFIWGGRTAHAYVIPRFKKNSKDKVKATFKKAVALLPNDIEAAFAEITELNGLGESYGSKILRMLDPKHVVTYDSVLTKDLLKTSANPSRYAVFCRDCQTIAKELTKAKVENISRGSTQWYAADVEGAIFRKIRVNG